MSDILTPSSQAYAALTKLAQRVNPEYQKWRRINRHPILMFTCNICGELMEAGKPSINHGAAHLKEHNLLVFL